MRILQRKSVERGAVGKREETKKVNSSAFNDIIRAYCKLALKKMLILILKGNIQN